MSDLKSIMKDLESDLTDIIFNAKMKLKRSSMQTKLKIAIFENKLTGENK